MIKTVCRQEIFELSKIADTHIASRQRFYFGQFEGEDPEVIASIINAYDHREPAFNKSGQPLEFCVLAYDEELNGTSYRHGFADAFSRFLKYLKIEEVILVQDLCRSWYQFGFDTETARLQFEELVGPEAGTNGFLLDHASLAEVFPTLFYNNPDEGDCSFYSLTADLPLSVLYWKGNLHMLFQEKNLDELTAAAKEAGLVMGSREVAHNYHFGKRLED